jgi:hypothetical protein
MFDLKPISNDSLVAALAKAERYRLLNEPTEAESICCDIIEVEPDNQQARITLTLALTDQISHDPHAFSRALSTLAQLQAPYDRVYYEGIAWERRAKARYHGGGHGAEHYTYEWILKALHLFERAESLRVPGNDDAVLRWNACVRFLSSHPELGPRVEDVSEPILSE